MVMVAFLNRANLALKPDHLCTILTQNTGRWRQVCKGGMCAVFGGNVMMPTRFQGEYLRAIGAKTISISTNIMV